MTRTSEALRLASALLLSVVGLEGQCPAPYLRSDPRYDREAAYWIPNGHPHVVGDLDGRGGPDVVLTDSPSFLQVFLNSGDGSLRRSWVPAEPSGVGGATLADVDQDGDLDVVVARLGGVPPIFFRNNGLGVIVQEVAGSRIPDALHAKSVAAADLDGDGWPDLFFGMETPHPSRVYLNDRSGGFRDASLTHLSSPVFGCVHQAVAADLDRDGDIDMVLAMGGNCGPQQENVVLLNDGLGHLTPSPLPGVRGWTGVVAIGDLNADGLPDLFFGNFSGPAELWLNQGRGLFRDESALVPGGTTSILAATILDVDGDGWNDVIAGVMTVGVNGARWTTCRNLGQAGFAWEPGAIAVSGPMNTAFAYAADMDRDGDDDLVLLGNVVNSRTALRVVVSTHRHVLPTDVPTLGQPWQLDLHAAPNQLVFPALAPAPADFAIPLLGVLGLDPASMVVLPFVDMRATCQQTLTLAIPNNPWLRGRPVYCQTYVLDPQNPAASHLTNWTVDTFR